MPLCIGAPNFSGWMSCVCVHRIDKNMVTSGSNILGHFCPPNRLEHHPMNRADSNLWRSKILEFFYGDRALPTA